jgi:hypothetical protein
MTLKLQLRILAALLLSFACLSALDHIWSIK